MLTFSCVYLTCKNAEDASKIGSWFRDKYVASPCPAYTNLYQWKRTLIPRSEFQGKKVSTAFASRDAIKALKTPAASE